MDGNSCSSNDLNEKLLHELELVLLLFMCNLIFCFCSITQNVFSGTFNTTYDAQLVDVDVRELWYPVKM